ncbi:hypothetical protein BCR33DRAFT_855209 [Rhizoclosmatium globosum]|uniref:MT-A70-domain-containing protein n=1 Tax=Rhizoclosmatium globosum TaxID=329046 RepID=A0A1Y2BQN6_9FUNG|nr:hypothetical protein BCR33DRAFT_855209 [Rhizoclosmatium globosum]|eukprot:ORY36465.1 hypothetical protein BCR33DRAFT_855209 [Rhizoclosmatium globosum]
MNTNTNTNTKSKSKSKKPPLPTESESTTESAPIRKSQRRSGTRVSAAYYVGYADDSESVASIMRKFSVLDGLQSELSTSMSTATASEPSSSSTTTSNLDQQTLEELFRRTSKVSVDLLAKNSFASIENDAFLSDNESEADAFVWEEEDIDHPDEIGMDPAKQRQKRKRKDTPSSSSSTPTESAINQKARSRAVILQAFQSGASKAALPCSRPDPTKPMHIRIPLQLTPAWGRIMEPLPLMAAPPPDSFASLNLNILNPESFKSIKEACAKPLIIYMDPPLIEDRTRMDGKRRDDGRISADELATLDIPSLIDYGFLFIWAEKEFTPKILKIADKWGFRYVENFAWIKWDKWHRIASEPGKYFRKSKTTCFIFRKEGESIDLKHQRNADCEFDFVKPASDDRLTQEKPSKIYDVIETMLPEALLGNGRLIELFARRDAKPRSGWTFVVDQTD